MELIQRFKSIKIFLILVGIAGSTLFYQNCAPGFKSANFNAASSSSTALRESSPTVEDFKKFQSLLASNCYACHANFQQYKSEADWKNLSNGLLVAGKPEESKIYTRLKLATLGSEIKNMPSGTSANLTQKEADFIRDYIKLIKPDPIVAIGTSASMAKLNYTCKVSGEGNASHAIRRLSDFELRNTIKDLFGLSTYTLLFKSKSTNGVETSTLDNIPAQQVTDSITTYYLFKKGQNKVNAEFLKSLDETAWNAVQTLASLSTAQRAAFFKRYAACYIEDGTMTTSCLDAFINSFGESAYRRKISATELSNFKLAVAEKTSLVDKMQTVIYGMLISPDFIYHYEVNGTESGNYLQLDQYALASRISYLITGSMPDAQLLTQARTNQFVTAVDISNTVDYLIKTYPDKVKENIWNFTQEWLRLGNTSFSNTPRANAIASGIINIGAGEGDSLRKANLQELKEMIGYYMIDQKMSYSDLILSDKSFTTDATLARLYGIPAWTKGTTPISHPTGQRTGFLTKAALTVRGADRNNPFVTGGTMYKHVLCRQFGSTTAVNSPAQIDPSVVRTTRQYFEAIVPRGTSCMSCHSQTEPFGMPFEEFDILGRTRNGYEKVYNDAGVYQADRPIDVTHVANINDKNINISGTADLIKRIDESKEAHACFATQIYKNYFGRLNSAEDSCMIDRMAQAATTGSMVDVFRTLAIDAWFKQRKIK